MNQKNVTQGQILLLVAISFVVLFGYFILSRREDKEWIDYQNGDGKYETIGNQLYIRDYRGYLYPKGYFNVTLNNTRNPFKDVNLEGQHSDTVLPECDDPDGVDPALTYQTVGWIEPPKYLSEYKNPCWYEVRKDGKEELQCIPYFYLIGMAKSGSTDLFSRIEQHPNVEVANKKEHRWFDDTRFANAKKGNFTYYFKQFHRSSMEIEKATNSSGYHYKICGDGSPSYSWDNIEWYHLPENQHCLEPRALILSYIHHLTPKAKLILILRNPVDRLYSHYLYHAKNTGARRDPEEFHLWVADTLDTYRECYKLHPFRFCMYSEEIKRNVKVTSLTSSIYSRLILDILKIFPRNQLFILEMKDYSANLKNRLKKVYEFLELEPLPESKLKEIVETGQRNAGRHYSTAGPMLKKTRKMLTDFLQPFNEELAQMLGDDKYLWLDE